MPPPQVRVLDTPAEAVAACAGLVAEALRQADAEDRPCTLCLSGGSTPKALYFLLSKQTQLPWRRAEFYWGDERYVPPDHRESNFRAAWELLLKPLAVPETAIHPVPTQGADPAADARRYETLLHARWPHAAAPAFDLQLLGLGPDGHTASLFPESPALGETERWVAVAGRPTAHAPGAEAHEGPRWRVTLTPPALAGARRTVFLVVGEEKSEAVRRALVDGDVPAALVKPAVPPLWLLDKAAAGSL